MKSLKSIAFLFLCFIGIAKNNAQDASKALKKGDRFIPFTLKNGSGKEVNIKNFLGKGPLVLVWYRGGWCPYCNVFLKKLQDRLPEIKQLGANLVAISPELPDNTLSTAEKDSLKFEILSDYKNEVARKYGLVFKLSNEIETKYENWFALSKHNGSNTAELPMPATYVIDKNGKIVFADVHADYKVRTNPDEIIEALKMIK